MVRKTNVKKHIKRSRKGKPFVVRRHRRKVNTPPPPRTMDEALEAGFTLNDQGKWVKESNLGGYNITEEMMLEQEKEQQKLAEKMAKDQEKARKQAEKETQFQFKSPKKEEETVIPEEDISIEEEPVKEETVKEDKKDKKGFGGGMSFNTEYEAPPDLEIGDFAYTVEPDKPSKKDEKDAPEDKVTKEEFEKNQKETEKMLKDIEKRFEEENKKNLQKEKLKAQQEKARLENRLQNEKNKNLQQELKFLIKEEKMLKNKLGKDEVNIDLFSKKDIFGRPLKKSSLFFDVEGISEKDQKGMFKNVASGFREKFKGFTLKRVSSFGFKKDKDSGFREEGESKEKGFVENKKKSRGFK